MPLASNAAEPPRCACSAKRRAAAVRLADGGAFFVHDLAEPLHRRSVPRHLEADVHSLVPGDLLATVAAGQRTP